MIRMLPKALYVQKKCLLRLFLYGKTLTKLGFVQQFIMEQSGQFRIKSAQKGHQLQQQLQSNLSTCFPYLLSAKNHMNTLIYCQFLVQSMITIII